MSVLDRIRTGELQVVKVVKLLPISDGYFKGSCINTACSDDQATKELLALAESGELMRWIPVGDPPKKCGWFLAAINPANFNDLTQEQINSWREEFGCTKTWFNPDSIDKWYEPNAHGRGCRPIKNIITHWSLLPNVPLPEPPKEGADGE
ncbi:hypothetical protein Ga0466249_002250 [Sporomusaceae bacterium BoRhaA]|uniref:hypothetical protein n=1 Tax=Pelorhabdus rhamnosifermentans TaxID=2772457 RepID=UPI001C061E3A|nr:hypothetical protein [Pelorhabdus rhamnosifermentans]MBU2701136.1 hypothetical protein [Pelorhabdus rhamnosifermentans]